MSTFTGNKDVANNPTNRHPAPVSTFVVYSRYLGKQLVIYVANSAKWFSLARGERVRYMMEDSLPPPGLPDRASQVVITSEEVNILVYLYLQESNYSHAALAFLAESALPSSSLFQRYTTSYPLPKAAPSTSLPLSISGRVDGSAKSPSSPQHDEDEDSTVPRGELVRKLWKALRWEEIERHVSPTNRVGNCEAPFRLLHLHRCEESNDLSSKRLNGATNAELLNSPQFSQIPDETNNGATSDSPPEPSPPVGLGDAGVTRDNWDVAPAVDEESKGLTDLAVSDDHKSTTTELPSSPHLVDDDAINSSSVAKEELDLHQRSTALAVDPSLPPSEGGTWIEHRDIVSCLSWNPRDKEVLASGSNDGTAKLWHFLEPADPHSSALRLAKKPSSIGHKSIDSGKKAVTALVWHPDGTVFATASDGVGRLFTPSGQLQGILTYGRGAINSLKFNPSGTSLLAAKDDFTVCLFVLDFDLKSPKQLSFEAHSKEVNDVDWLDDDIFASGGNDHTIFIYRANDRRPRFTLKGHTDDVTRVKWSPPLQGIPDQKRLLASVADDGTIMVWKLPHYPADRSTGSRSLSPSKHIRDKDSATDDFLQVAVTPGSEYCLRRLLVVDSETDNKRMNTLEWAPDCQEGHMIVAAGGQDSTVKLFNAETGDCLHVLSGLEAGTGCIAFSPLINAARPHGILAGGGWDGKLCFWDAGSGEVLKEYEIEEAVERQTSRDRPMMLAMSWRHDGLQLATGLHNKSLMTVATQSLL